jgi:hypothetical protein
MDYLHVSTLDRSKIARTIDNGMGDIHVLTDGTAWGTDDDGYLVYGLGKVGVCTDSQMREAVEMMAHEMLVAEQDAARGAATARAYSCPGCGVDVHAEPISDAFQKRQRCEDCEAAEQARVANDRAAERQLADGFARTAASVDPDSHRRAILTARDALAELAADVESGSVRLTHYPEQLPSLPELVAAIDYIGTYPTLSHDQLTTFGKLAHEASIGGLVDGNGAISDLSVCVLPNGVAEVRTGGEVVATIAADTGTLFWVNSPAIRGCESRAEVDADREARSHR